LDEAARNGWLSKRQGEKEKLDEAAIGCVSEIINERLEKENIDNFWPGDEYNEHSSIPRLLKRTIHMRKAVYALLTHNGSVDVDERLKDISVLE
jgi:hypothetical protein